jgi:hypothetical protein
MRRGFLLHPTHITSPTKATNFEETGAYQRVLGCPSTRQDHCHHATRKPAKFANLQRVPFASMCHPPLLNYSTARCLGTRSEITFILIVILTLILTSPYQNDVRERSRILVL